MHLDFTEYANKEGLVENPDRPLRTPKPGDVVVMFLLGAGPTAPLVPPGTVPSGGEAITGEAELRIGERVVETQIVLSGFVGLYQAAFTVPDLPAGDYRMELSIDGISSGQELYFTIGE